MRDLARDEYENFDDYIEMTVQLGYAIMFAAAMPLAATVACAYTAVEMRSDLFKLLHLERRPLVTRPTTLGAWDSVLQVGTCCCKC